MRMCQADVYRGPRRGQPCRYPARWWNPTWRLFLCGVHVRGYLHAVPIRVVEA